VSGGNPAATELHCANVVVPVSQPPIRNGAVAVQRGIIVAVGDIDEVRHLVGHASERHWPGVLTPGLVNAHTHLQYTSFGAVGATAFPDYTAWSVRFLEEYDRLARDDWTAVARSGAVQMLQAGITAIADVVTDFAARDVLYDLEIPGVTYLEIIGVDEGDWMSGLESRLRDAITSAPTTPATSVGISPHAPYSVDGPVLTAAMQLARSLGVRVHIHVAESDGEDELYRTATGSLAERLRTVATRRVGVLDNGGTNMGAGAFMRHLGATGSDTHFAHGVYLDAEGRRIVADDHTVVALCPRSNRIVGVDLPPVADYLREDIPFAVGTDSLASVESLDLMADVALLRQTALAGGYTGDDLDQRLLHAATLGGATALGLEQQLGSLQVGKRADLAVFDVPDRPDRSDQGITTDLVKAGPGNCMATMVGGNVRWRRV